MSEISIKAKPGVIRFGSNHFSSAATAHRVLVGALQLQQVQIIGQV